MENGIAAAGDDGDIREIPFGDGAEAIGILADHEAVAARLQRPSRRLIEHFSDTVFAVIWRVPDENIKGPIHPLRRSVVGQNHFCGDAEVARIDVRRLDRPRMGIDHDKREGERMRNE